MAEYHSQEQDLEEEISDLEMRLESARARLLSTEKSTPKAESTPMPSHALLLLSDSALPLGSFAYSSGLESYLSHLKLRGPVRSHAGLFDSFLTPSIASMASTTLPYLLAAYRKPDLLETIDNDLDASTPCIVAQRASLAQGRALLNVWERGFRRTYSSHFGSEAKGTAETEAIRNLAIFSDHLKTRDDAKDGLGLQGHFAPLWGVVCLAMGLTAQQTVYLYMLNHAKAVLSAGVRASLIGPYQAQAILGSRLLQETIADRVKREWDTPIEQAGQVVPMIDLWVGRHELLYSRIFNS